MFELQNVTKIYETANQVTVALNNVSLRFPQRGFFAITGPSGCGKTTLLNVISGLDTFDSGTLKINDVDISTYTTAEFDTFRYQNLGFIFQNYNLLEHLTVYENLEFSLLLGKNTESERRERIEKLLEKFDILNIRDKKASVLSGGEKQRVAVARALVNKPKIILADEPTGALDSKNSLVLFDLLKQLSEEYLIIVVTHNQALAEQYADQVIRMKDGQVLDEITDVTPLETLETPQVKPRLRWWGVFKIGFKNISLNKIRSALVILAMLFGMVGVFLVLSVSHGIVGYVDDVKSDISDQNPITINSAIDEYEYEKLEEEKRPAYPSEFEGVYVIDPEPTYYTYGQVNEFTEQFISYVNNLDPELYSQIYYYETMAFNIVGWNGSQYRRVRTYLYESATDEYNESHYELLAGSYPKAPGDVALVVDSTNAIQRSTLKTIGFDAQDKTILQLEDLVNHEYRYASINEVFYKDGEVYKETTDLEQLYNNATFSLRISGVIRQKPDMQLRIYRRPGLVYSQAFKQYIQQTINESQIVQEQLAAGLSKNVFTGQPFEDTVSGTTTLTKQYQYEQQLVKLGVRRQIRSINIYSKTYASRQAIIDELNAYNLTQSEAGKIKFYDRYGDFLRDLDAFIILVSRVLTLFMVINLIIAGIMMGVLAYVSVIERLKMIGIIRCIGGRRTDVVRIFVMENVVIGVISGILGVALGILLLRPVVAILIHVINRFDNVTLSKFTYSNVVLQPLYVIIILFIGIAIAFVASIIPATIAGRQKPIEIIKR